MSRKNFSTSQPFAAPIPENQITFPESYQSRFDSFILPGSSSECSLCYETTSFVAVGACGHGEVCWLCAIRLRWICKDNNCAICKENLEIVDIVRVDSSKPITTSPNHVAGINFHSDSILAESTRLKSYYCPYPCGDETDKFHFKSLADLQTHLKRDHHVTYCNICLNNRQCFLPEQKLYKPSELVTHGKTQHSSCDFCRGEKFYSGDELVVHMNQCHFKCIVCDRLDYRNEYYANFDSLNSHSSECHYPCDYPECKEQRFVVFPEEEDLRLHWLEKHGRGRAIGIGSSVGNYGNGRKRGKNKYPGPMSSVVHFRGPKVPASHQEELVILHAYPDVPGGRVYDKKAHSQVVLKRVQDEVFGLIQEKIEKISILCPKN